MVTVAIIGILSAISAPFFLSYWRAATLRAGADELAATLNGARQVAIKQNTSVCVTRDASRVRYLLSATCDAGLICLATAPPFTPPCIWTGAGSDGNGWIALSNSVQVTANTANVVFTYLGAANPAGSYTVTNPTDGRTLRVVVAASGRITIAP